VIVNEKAMFCQSCGSRIALDESERLETARVGYQVAADIFNTTVDIVGARFNAMIVANSIVIGSIGLVLTSGRPLQNFVVLFGTVGILLNILWLHLLKRGFDYGQFIVLAAREIEENYLSNPLRILKEGGDFEKGEQVRLAVAGQPPLRASWLARRAKAQYSSLAVVAVFIAMYLVAIFIILQ
jgi:hypothetical protein